MRLFFCLLYLLLFFVDSSAQETKLSDTDANKLENASTDYDKVDAYIDLYVKFHTLNSDSALYYAEEAFKLSKETGYLEGQIKSLTSIGSIHFDDGLLGKALECYLLSTEILDEYIEKNKVDDFARYQLSKNLNNIGLIYLNQQKFEEAENYLLRSLEIDIKLENQRAIANCYHNLGTLKESQGNYAGAIDYYTKSYAIKLEENNIIEIPSTLINIGVVRMNENFFYEADTCFQAAIEYCKKGDNYKDLCLAYINLGDLNFIKKDFDRAISNYFLALEICEEYNYKNFLVYAYESISLSYARMQNYKGAYEYFQLYSKTKDEMNSEENRVLITELQTKFETENKEKEIVLLNKEKNLKDIELKNNRTILIISFVGLAAISLFLVLLIFSYKQKQKINAEINLKNQKLEIAYNVVEEKNREITDSINYAKRIQNAILPPRKLVKEYIPDSFILYKPKDVVAGDFYWMEQKEDKILFAAADCTGHGVPGAMVSVICNNGLNRSVREYGLIDPGKILDKTRDVVISEFEKSEEEVKDGMDISLCALDFKNQILCWAGANNPLWIIRNSEIVETKSNKQPIGVVDNPQPFTTHKIELQKGDVIYVFTDGFQDQFGGERGKKFKSANFKKLLLSIYSEPMGKQHEILDKTFEDWKGDLEQLDDVCVIGVRL